MKQIHFACRLSNKSKPLPHFREHTVGSGHAPLALRADGQRQLRQCHEERAFRHIRFHDILSDDMGTLMDEQNHLLYSFFNADQICDFLLSIGMKPFVELSFMPSTLSSGNKTVFNYSANITPPNDYSEWGKFVARLVTHWVERYSIDEVSAWFFEVWNEPNLPAFWTGTQGDYFKLYRFTVEAIKEVDDRLKVGGPATANNESITEFLDFCKKKKLPADFVSTHHYPTDALGSVVRIRRRSWPTVRGAFFANGRARRTTRRKVSRFIIQNGVRPRIRATTSTMSPTPRPSSSKPWWKPGGWFRAAVIGRSAI